MSELTRVFVYGTLKRGHPNHYLLSEQNSQYGDARFVGTASLVNKYPLVIFTKHNIPFLLAEEGQGENVHGEVYSVDSKLLAKLDDLEQHPKIYTRSTQCCLMNQSASSVEQESGSIVECEVYLLYNYNKAMLSELFLSDYSLEVASNRSFNVPKEVTSAALNDYIKEIKEQ